MRRLICSKRSNYKASNELFRGAAKTPAGNQLRVLNGWFLSSWNLNRASEAEEAAGQLADYGLERKSFSMMFLFPPGRAQFIPDRKVSGSYPVLLRGVARKTAATPACLQVIGHASRSGAEPANEKLSLARANYVKQQLEKRREATCDAGHGRGSWIPRVDDRNGLG